MSRLLNSSGAEYELLDDHCDNLDHFTTSSQRLQIDTDNYIADEDDITGDESGHCGYTGPGVFSAIKQIRIPRVNFRYFKYRYKSMSERQQVCLSLGLCIFVLTAVHVKCASLGYYTVFVHKPAPVIDKSYTAFQIPYHKASLNYKAFQSAGKNHTPFVRASFNGLQNFGRGYKHSTRRSMPKKWEIIGGRPGGPYDTGNYGRREKRSSSYDYVVEVPLQWHPQWKMQVIFLTKEGENIFTKEKLQKIHEVEKLIMKHENFSDFCFKDTHPVIAKDPAIKSINGCSPLNSLMTYFYPSKDGNGNVFYDGLGENMDNIDSALKLAMTSQKFYYYVDDKTNSSNRRSQLLRTEVLFGVPLKGYGEAGTSRTSLREQGEKYKKFIVTYIDLLSKVSNDDVSVLYGGNEIFDYEIETTFWNDVKLAGFALGAIFILMLILTAGSLWLTIMGLCSILLSAPLAIFFYRVVFNVIGLGILNGAAAFVIIGIGVDDVFVFINVFRQADHIKGAGPRVWFTMVTAGKATFFTSFTTAAAFAANIASMIPAVHDFGLFMSLIVACCWYTVMLIMPPALYIWYISFSQWEASLFSIFCRCKTKSCSLKLPEDVANFMDGNRGNLNHGILTREVTNEDIDVPMLSMDQPTQYQDDEDDDPLLMLDPDPLTVPDNCEDLAGHQPQKNCLGSYLQAVLYHSLALPFIKGRWVIIVLSTILLAVSIGLITQLQTSSKPPQFFKPETNIQRLLDLKAKFSTIDSVSCYDCSAIYSIGQTQDPTRPPDIPVIGPETTPAVMPRPHVPPTTSAARPKPTVATTTRVTTTQPSTTPVRTDPPTKSDPRCPNGSPPTGVCHSYDPCACSETEFCWTPGICCPTEKPRAKPSSCFSTPNPITPAPPTHHPFHPPAEPKQPQPRPTAKSVPKDFDVCKTHDCSHPQKRPLLEFGATVYVVLGVKQFHFKDTNTGHVMQQTEGTVEFDSGFSKLFNFSNPDILYGMKQLCEVCKAFARNTELVKNGSAQCFPIGSIPTSMRVQLIDAVPECRDLRRVSFVFSGQQQPAHAVGGLTKDGSAILWLGFAFESTTSKGQSYFEAYNDYQKWEDFVDKVKQNITKNYPGSPLVDMFQTSDFWPEVLMEVVAVNSAIYGVVLSIIICMVAVMVFTGHVQLLLIIFICIAEMVSLVVGIFYMLNWEIGGVEAISLSILVGSSVDYCVHLVEGYILAGSACPIKDNPAKSRQWRTSAAFSHIGVSILSSAVTTIIAAIPLTQTAIQPFAKFGQIIAINTTVCIVYSLTVCTAFLSTIGPAYFKPSWKSIVKSIVGTCIFVGMAVLAMFVMSKCGIHIPGPNGSNLF